MSNEKMETKKSDEFLSTLEAAQKEDADAQFALGDMYKHSIGIAQDYELAFKYYQLAAEQGNIDAQVELSVMYYDGQGVEPDREKSYELHAVALKNLQDGYKEYLLGAEQGEAKA